MRYHNHKERCELWGIESDSGTTVIDDYEIYAKTGDVVELPMGSKHTIIATSEL